MRINSQTKPEIQDKKKHYDEYRREKQQKNPKAATLQTGVGNQTRKPENRAEFGFEKMIKTKLTKTWIELTKKQTKNWSNSGSYNEKTESGRTGLAYIYI